MGRISSATMVGRDDELARLHAALAATSEGEPGVVLIGGDAGIGKTRLVTEFTTSLDAQVLAGGCLQLGTGASPLAPISEILRALNHERGEHAVRRLLAGPRATLAGLLTATSTTRERSLLGGPDAGQLHEAVLSLLEALATDGQLVVVIEDLHWAAPAMLDVVTFLAHNPPRGPVTLLLTYRADDIHAHHPGQPVLAELGRLATVDHIDLPPLAPNAQRRQGENILGRTLTNAEARDLATRAEGNAFYAEELLAAADTSGPLPSTVRAVLTSRLTALTHQAAEVVRVAAAAGRTVDHRLLESVAELDAGALRSGLRAAVEHGVLVPDDHRYRFRHALLQEAAYDDLLPGERLRLHHALADALAADRALAADGAVGADAEIAHHAERARLPDLAYSASLAAADHADRVFAFDEALAHLERALTLRGSCAAEALEGSPTRLELLRRAGLLADSAGHPRRGIAHLETALTEESDTATDAQIADVLNDIALTCKNALDPDMGERANVRALAVAPAGSTQRATTLALQGLINAIPRNRPSEAMAPAREAVALARALGDRALESIALMVLGTAHGRMGQFSEAEPLLRRAIDLAVDNGQMVAATMSSNNLSVLLCSTGRVAEALQLQADWLRRCDAQGYATPDVDFLRCNHIERLVLSGHVTEAATLETTVRPRHGTRSVAAAHRMAALCLYLTQARFRDAVRLFDDDKATVEHVYSQYLARTVEAKALLALVERQYDEAWEILNGARDTRPIRGTHELIRPAAARVEADRLAAGAVDDATRERSLERFAALEADLEEMLADAGDAPTWTAHLRTARAQVAAERTRAEGRPDPDAWLAAEEGVAAQGRVPEVAYLRIRRAEALVGVDRRDEAIELLREVHADCVERGMVWCAQQAEAVAKRARIKLPGVETPSDNPFGLTDRERDVLTLLAEGLTNPQIGERLFISDKTASVHVSHILTKLGATNRNQAAAIARDHGLAGKS